MSDEPLKQDLTAGSIEPAMSAEEREPAGSGRALPPHEGAVEAQTLSDHDQTIADSDQTGADLDQTSADADETASERDQHASDRDQDAADRDQAAGVTITTRRARARTGMRALGAPGPRAPSSAMRHRGCERRPRACATRPRRGAI